ncbi:unnamed protein product [Auanema sp. JU1783]|nr:unnamed protein product [Auanema sp. JU1783]
MGRDRIEGRVKLEIPHSNHEVHNIHKKILVQCFDQYHFTIDDGTSHEIEEIGCLKFIDVHYVIGNQDYRKNFLPAIQKYLNELSNVGLPHHYKGILTVFSPECFDRSLITVLEKIPTSAVMFGNIQSGVFMSHWEVSFSEEQATESRNKKRLQDQMYTDFEFDRADMIVCSFNTPERGYEQATKRSFTRHAKYRIVIQRSFVRRIIVDTAVNDCHGKNRIRMYIELNCPPFIKRSEENQSKQGLPPRFDRNTTIKRGRFIGEYAKDAAIADSSFIVLEFGTSVELATLYSIISRLRTRCLTPIEFATLPVINCFLGRYSPYYNWLEEGECPLHENEPFFKRFLEQNFPNDKLLSREQQLENSRKAFVIRYLIECLISRGAVVKDQLWLVESHWKHFLNVITVLLHENFDMCEIALERLVTLLDERKRVGSITKCLIELFREATIAKSEGKFLAYKEKKDGYNRVRKIIFTPTRVVYVVPEMLMSNRVIRNFDGDGTKVLRIQFRDDDNQKMRQNKTSKLLIDNAVRKRLTNGVTVAGRDFGYLGSSNSQMRDNGAYFLLKNRKVDIKKYLKQNKDAEIPPTLCMYIQQVRNSLGRFDNIESVPKYMARLGQCFTQSKETRIRLEKDTLAKTYDVVGGCVPEKLSPYTFSDGVGVISKQYAQRIATDFNGSSEGYPSCFQFRLKGMKGVVSVDPYLDELAAWAIENEIPNLKEDEACSSIRNWLIHCAVRDSQIKFTGTESALEIVKPSAPVPVALNKPFINILDQVAEMQSSDSHTRIVGRIQQLLDKQIRGFASSLVYEHDCRVKLKELPRRIDIDRLHQRAGFTMCDEPFFRSLVKSATKYAITKQLRKEQIQIPYELGRSMLGILDETGRLQYGQIFVQYTKNIQDKFPTIHAPKAVLTGKVLITKNPCNVAGDVRVFEAIDVKELRHLVDVVVFPQHGPRPHPDEMAGSDLDGDEYSVIWDPDLLLDRNEPAFDYTPDSKRIEKLDDATLNEKMIDFYLNYMLQDSVGVISNNFLHQSALYGINSTVCINLAKKISMAVDFTKSGKPPPALTKAWTSDPQTKEDIPPEAADIIPDYHGDEHGNKPVYVCPRLIGQLYRDIKSIEDVLRISEDRDDQLRIKIDESIFVEGWENYRATALQDLAKYNNLLRTVMENYGIQTEAEAFSGYICEMRNRISDKDQDDMSFFNTNLLIESKITSIFRKFREEFFEEFGGWKQSTQKIEKPPTPEMKQKAVAYYRVCYERAATTKEKKLSFAWVAYDILAEVRQAQSFQKKEFLTSSQALTTMMDKHSELYIEENGRQFEDFCRIDTEDRAGIIIKKYLTVYPGLERAMFIICEWAKIHNLFTERFRSHHLCLLFLQHGNGILPCFNADATKPFIQIPVNTSLEEIVNGSIQKEIITSNASVLVPFFEYLASRKFFQLDSLSFSLIGLSSCFLRGEWRPIHKAARKSYYNMVFNLRFEELRLSSDPKRDDAIIRECEPFCIQLPDRLSSPDVDRVRDKLKQKAQLVDIVLRPLSLSDVKGSRFMVSAKGSLEAIDRLKELVVVKPHIKGTSKGKGIIDELTNLVYKKIMS